MRLRLVGSPWDSLTDGQIFVRPNSPPRLSLCDHLSDLIGQKFVSQRFFSFLHRRVWSFSEATKNGVLGRKKMRLWCMAI